ncbi:MAG: OmpA family protein [Myxococcota bacterium]|jgi:chemotaxis protein MotB|nr:OmpA family protein [Myxococcota bacterium]
MTLASKPTVLGSCLLPLLVSSLAIQPGCVPKSGSATLIEQLDREVIALREHNELLYQRAETCSDPNSLPPAIFTELRSVFSGSEVVVERDGMRTMVIVPGSMLFAPGSTQVRREATMVLDLLSTGLNLHPDAQIWIIGHTDSSPVSGSLKRRFPSNWELSSARASSFMRSLVDSYGVAQERFTVGGRGAVEPVVSNDTPEGRAKNRRIVVIVGPKE